MGFDWNERIRVLVDDLPAEILRYEPTGRDIDGKIYWTQIDDHAEIRIYAEDYRHDTWGNIVQNRVELVNLIEKLKDGKLYKQELEKIKIQEADIQDQNAVIDVITEIEKEKETKANANAENKCEVCNLEFGTALILMEHYSGGHMSFKLKEKFRHLVEHGKCKMCKFEAENDKLIWIHIGAFHEKVNSVLKESKLKPVQNNVKVSKEEKTNQEGSVVPEPKEVDDEIIDKIENEIEKLKNEMIENEKDKRPILEVPTEPTVQNNQESEEVLGLLEGNGNIKANTLLNLDGITDIEEDLESHELSAKNGKCESNEDRKTRSRRGNPIQVKEEANARGRKGRKNKGVVTTAKDLQSDGKPQDTEKSDQKSKPSVPTQKENDPKIKTDYETNESVDRPRRGRACKEKAEIIKIANTSSLKKEKEKSMKGNTKSLEIKGQEIPNNEKLQKDKITDEKTDNNSKEGKNTRNKNTSKEKKDGDKKEASKTVTENGKGMNKKRKKKEKVIQTEVNKNEIKKENSVKVEQDKPVKPMVGDKKEPKKKGGKPKRGNTPIADSKGREKDQKNEKEDIKISVGKKFKNESNIQLSFEENELQQIDSKEDKATIKEEKGKALIEKLIMENKDENEDAKENPKDKPNVMKLHGKRKGTGEEIEKLIKKKKVEDTETEKKNTREKRSRNVKTPFYEEPDETIYEDFQSEAKLSSEESENTTKQCDNQKDNKSKEINGGKKTTKEKINKKVKAKQKKATKA